MKKWMAVLLLVAVYCLLSGCKGNHRMILEYNDVQGFEVKKASTADTTQLRISGLAFHSSLAVGKITTQVSGRDMLVKIILVPARKGLSGRFDYTVDIPNGVNRVFFGNEKHQIWPLAR